MRAMFEGNRRAVIAGAVGLGLVVVVLVVRLLTSGGGPPAALTPPVIPGAGSSSTVAPGAPGSVAPTTTVPAGQIPPSAQVYNSKDPFTPLVSASTTVPATTVTTTSTTGSTRPTTTSTTTSTTKSSTTTSTTTVSPTTTTTISSSGSSGASGAGTGTGTSTSPTSGQPVELEDIYATGSQTYASIEVDDSLYQVMTGQTFAGNYSVLDLSLASQCGDFSHGGVPFHLCKGQEVLK